MTRHLVFCLALLFIGASFQATEPDIARLVARVNNGESEQVRTEIPMIVARYPNNAGVQFVQGLVTREGAEAVRIYQSIVDNFPQSEWADAALYKVYQFYYSLGLYRTAEMKMEQLRRDYPNSKYPGSASETETAGLPEEHAEVKSAAAPVEHGIPTGVGGNDTTVDTARPLQFTLQVGAYTGQSNAEKQKAFFESLGYSVEVMSKVKENRSLFLVLVGSYSTFEEAQAKRAQIKQVYNVDSMVISK